MGKRIASAVIDSDIWDSIINRSKSVTTAVAMEYVCLKYLIEIYPKEKQSGMKGDINIISHAELKKAFEPILKEVEDAKKTAGLK
jgi:hypothetical protein